MGARTNFGARIGGPLLGRNRKHLLTSRFADFDPFRTSEGAHRAAKPPILRPRAWISRGARQVPRKPAGGNRARSTDWHLPGHSFAGSSLRRPHSHAYSSNRLSSLASLRAWPCVVPAKG